MTSLCFVCLFVCRLQWWKSLLHLSRYEFPNPSSGAKSISILFSCLWVRRSVSPFFFFQIWNLSLSLSLSILIAGSLLDSIQVDINRKYRVVNTYFKILYCIVLNKLSVSIFTGLWQMCCNKDTMYKGWRAVTKRNHCGDLRLANANSCCRRWGHGTPFPLLSMSSSLLLLLVHKKWIWWIIPLEFVARMILFSGSSWQVWCHSMCWHQCF